jgi:hypothetical protein
MKSQIGKRKAIITIGENQTGKKARRTFRQAEWKAGIPIRRVRQAKQKQYLPEERVRQAEKGKKCKKNSQTGGIKS